MPSINFYHDFFAQGKPAYMEIEFMEFREAVGLVKNLAAELRGIFDPVFILFVLANPRSRAAGNRACELGEANARAGFNWVK